MSEVYVCRACGAPFGRCRGECPGVLVGRSDYLAEIKADAAWLRGTWIRSVWLHGA